MLYICIVFDIHVHVAEGTIIADLETTLSISRYILN